MSGEQLRPVQGSAMNSEARKRHQEARGINTEPRLLTHNHPDYVGSSLPKAQDVRYHRQIKRGVNRNRG